MLVRGLPAFCGVGQTDRRERGRKFSSKAKYTLDEQSRLTLCLYQC